MAYELTEQEKTLMLQMSIERVLKNVINVIEGDKDLDQIDIALEDLGLCLPVIKKLWATKCEKIRLKLYEKKEPKYTELNYKAKN